MIPPPRIGVTGPRRRALAPRACTHLALRLAGAQAVQLRPGDATDLEGLEGVVITGGHDVQPTLYAAAPEVRSRYDPERDAFESAVLASALEREKPVLAICRGAQLLNVLLGGSLLQDLRPRRRQTSNRRSVLPLKTLHVEPGTRLLEIVGAPRLRVNSLHRQAIDRVGRELRVSGRDLDDIVQAVEHTRHEFVLGVQWHPELLLCLGRQRRLFRALVRAAGRHSSHSERERSRA